MYPSDVGLKFMVQQAVSGTGRFDGTEYGRARLTMDPGLGVNSRVSIASRLFGTPSNALTVEYVDAGLGATVSTTKVIQTGALIQVLLRRSPSAILATSAEVAAAINAFTAYTSQAFAICARALGTGGGLVTAIAPTSLSGGHDPTIVNNQYLWTVPANGNGGLIHFEHTQPVWLLGFGAKFTISLPGPYSVTIYRVRLDTDLTVIGNEAIGQFVYGGLTPSASDIAYSDVKQLVQPGQAIAVVTSAALPGFFQFDVVKASNYPSI